MRKERPARGRRGSILAEREDGGCFADASKASISGSAGDTWLGLADLWKLQYVKDDGLEATKQSSCSLCLLDRRQIAVFTRPDPGLAVTEKGTGVRHGPSKRIAHVIWEGCFKWRSRQSRIEEIRF